MADPVAKSTVKTIYGDDEYLEGVVTGTDGLPVDLTAIGVDLTYTLKKGVTSPTAILTKNKASGIAVGADGTYTITITDTDKASLSNGAVYDFTLRLTEADGTLTTVAHGQHQVHASAGG